MNQAMKYLQQRFDKRFDETFKSAGTPDELKKIDWEFEQKFHELRESLNEAQRELLFELDSLAGSKIAYVEERFFNFGVQEGMEIAEDLLSPNNQSPKLLFRCISQPVKVVR